VIHQSGPAASASYSLLGSIIIFTFIGKYFDDKYQTMPVFLLWGVLLGLLVGFYGLYKTIYPSKDRKNKNL
jgi:F0F1-type ATP synthase assembly protein I